MAYVDYSYFKSIYGDAEIDETTFNRLSWNAEREIDKATSGADNVRKLRVAFPVDEYDAETVKRCVCELIELLNQIESAEKSANAASGFIKRADGTLQGKVITSVTAGSESISYAATGGTSETAAKTASKSLVEKDMTIRRFIESRLSGIQDKNGVNLLFMGTYPYKAKIQP